MSALPTSSRRNAQTRVRTERLAVALSVLLVKLGDQDTAFLIRSRGGFHAADKALSLDGSDAGEVNRATLIGWTKRGWIVESDGAFEITQAGFEAAEAVRFRQSA